MKIVVAMTGASGAIYTQRLLDNLDPQRHEIHFISTKHARQVANGKVMSRELADEVAAALKMDLAPIEDLHGDQAVKLHLAQVLARRVVERMTGA